MSTGLIQFLVLKKLFLRLGKSYTNANLCVQSVKMQQTGHVSLPGGGEYLNLLVLINTLVLASHGFLCGFLCYRNCNQSFCFPLLFESLLRRCAFIFLAKLHPVDIFMFGGSVCSVLFRLQRIINYYTNNAENETKPRIIHETHVLNFSSGQSCCD